MRNSPEIVEVNDRQLEQVLRRLDEGTLDAEDFKLSRGVFQSYAYFSKLVENKNTSIRRLRELLFGMRTETTKAVLGKPQANPPEAAPETSPPATNPGTAADAKSNETRSARKGHGRNGADAYRGAARIDVPHPSLKAGCACPTCGEGIVYEKAPGVLVRIIGQAPLAANIYELHKLRCHLCGEVFTAEEAVKSILLEIFGNPFQSIVVDNALLTWKDRTVERMACTAYGVRDSFGHLDSQCLAILADAVEEAGCTNDLLLGHFRSRSLHFRGCWALDTLYDPRASSNSPLY